jgi:hypothetical protein
MIMGFISLLLPVFQTSITSLCMPQDWAPFMLPCPYVPRSAAAPELAAPPAAAGRHNPTTPPAGHSRRRLLEWGAQNLVHNRSIDVAIAGGRKLLARIERRLNEARPVDCPVVRLCRPWTYSIFKYLHKYIQFLNKTCPP